MMEYPWRGNLFQVESFCERLILTAGKRSIDENTVKRLLGELYPEPSVPDCAPGLNPPGEGALEEEPEELRRIRAAAEKVQWKPGKNSRRAGNQQNNAVEKNENVGDCIKKRNEIILE